MYLLGSIIHLQIVAHLPLTSIYMPANVKQIFQFGVEIVSFDYFAPFEYIDADFTETWAWSPEFDWMGYE